MERFSLPSTKKFPSFAQACFRVIKNSALTIGLILGGGGKSGLDKIQDPPIKSNKPFIIQHLEKKYNISFIYAQSSEKGKLRFKSAGFSSQFFEAIDHELSRFPREMIQASGVKKIYIVSDLQVDNGSDEHRSQCKLPWCEHLQSIFGYKLTDGNGLYISNTMLRFRDEVAVSDSISEEEILGTLKHEIFHHFDERGNEKTGDEQENTYWAKLHGGDFIYNTKSLEDKGKRWSRRGKTMPGFVPDGRAFSSANEDQAQTCEYLLSRELYSSVLKQAKHDTILRKKIEVMTGCKFDPLTVRFSRVLTLTEYRAHGYDDYNYWFAWSNGKMDNKWWNNYLDDLDKTQ